MTIRHASVLHLRFDEGSGSIASDSSGMGYHGALSGSPLPSWVSGKYGQALSFDGSHNYVSIPDITSAATTIAAWVKMTAYPSSGVALIAGTAHSDCLCIDSGAGAGKVWSGADVGSAIPLSTWTHLAIVSTGTTKLLYVNGTYIATITQAPYSLGSGVGGLSGGQKLNGIIDEAIIFNRALSPTEIMNLYMQAPPAWIIKYFDGTRWVEVPAARFDNSSEELNGHEEATFLILNTAANRAFVLNDYPVNIYCNYGLVYSGIMKAVGYSMTQLAVTCYNQVYETLQKRSFTGAYDATAANTVLGAITGTGGASTQNFGDMNIEASEQHCGSEAKDAVQCQMLNVSGSSLTDIYGAVRADPASAHVKIGVYSDSGGSPNALLGVSDEVTLSSSTMTWTPFHFSTPISLTANAYYWFAIINDADVYWALTWSGINNVAFNWSSVYSSGFSDPFGSVDLTYSGVSASFYAVISVPSAGGGVCPTTAVTVKYDNTNSYDASAGLAKILNKDYWGDTYFNIGVRNSCVLCLPFEDAAGYVVTDVSGNENDGAVYPVAGNFSFGRSDTGSEDYACSANYKYASKFTAGTSGYLSKLSAYVKRNSSSGKMRLALYADSAGSPGALIAQTLEVTVGTSMGWVDFPFSTLAQPAVANGTSYWLAVLTDAAYTMRDQSGSGNVKRNADTYSDGFANPFGSPSTTSNKELSIYASGYLPPPQWVAGKYGKALSFDGVSTYVQIPDSPNLEIIGNLTLACWIYINSLATNQMVIAKDVSHEYALNLVSNGQIEFDQQGSGFFTSAGAVTSGSWIHLALVRDVTAKTLTFYVNGAQFGASQSFTTLPTSGTNPVTIGTFGGANMFNGIIDEVIICNRNFSAYEINFIYSCRPYGGGSASGNATGKRRIDRSKVRSAITVKGVDLQGNKITGSAGTGSDIQVLTQIEPADVASLNSLAASALTQLSQEGAGSQINLPISVGAYMKPGDTVPIRIDQLAMSDNYRIQKIQKKNNSVSIAVEKSISILESLLNQVKASSIQQISERAGVAFTRGLSSASPPSPAAGDQWYQTDTNQYYYYSGSGWTQYQPV